MKKFTLFIMMLVMCATTTFAQTAITSVDDVKPGKAYWFANYWLQSFGVGKYPSGLYYPTEDARYHGQVYAAYYFSSADNMENPDQQFAFVEYDGKYYFYSVGADKFVTMKNRLLYTTDIPYTHVAVIDHPDYQANPEYYPLALAFGDDGLLLADYPASTYYINLGCLYCFTPEAGSYPANATSWNLYEVGDLENADALTERLATAMVEGKKKQEEASDNLMYTFEEAEDLLSDINYMYTEGTEIELQVADPDAPNYIWCNEPEESEGLIEGLIDDNKDTFFHSCWNGTMEPEHWLQVDLGVALKDFQFNYHTRVGAKSSFPQTIEVKGSNDGDYFETITTFNSGLPTSADKSWESGNINADKEYKHLRFVIASENVFFHMAEFNLLTETTITVEDLDYEPYLKYLIELEKVVKEAKEFWENNPNATVDEYNAYTEKVREALNLVKSLVSGEPDDKTIAFIEECEAILAKEGVGYPAEAPRTVFKAAIDAAKADPSTQARFDLEVALSVYRTSKDIVLPTDGVQYTLTFITPKWERNYLSVDSYEVDGEKIYQLYNTRDTYTSQGQPLPESAAFTCVDHGDGTYDFTCAEGKYLTVPEDKSEPGTETGIIDYPTYFTIERMYTTKYTGSTKDEEFFGLVVLNNAGIFMIPTRDTSYFYIDYVPNFVSAWSSAMAIEVYNPVTESIENVVVENPVKGIYDLSGRKVENPTKGIYIIDGKKVLVK